MKQFIKDAIQVWIDYRLDISFSKKDFWRKIGFKWNKEFGRGFPGV